MEASVFLVTDKYFHVRPSKVDEFTITAETDFDLENERFNGKAQTATERDVTKMMKQIHGINRVMNQNNDILVEWVVSYNGAATPKIQLKVRGPFIHRLFKEFINKSWKIMVDMKLSLAGTETCDTFTQELRPIFTEDYTAGSIFGVNWRGQLLNFDYRNAQPYYFGSMTMEISKLDVNAYLERTVLLPCQEMNKRILEERDSCDFELVSKNGVLFPCHSMIVKDISMLRPIFESQQFVEAQNRSSRLELSEMGVTALLEFVYYNNLELLRDAKLAVELFKFARFSLYEKLEKAVKEVILSTNHCHHWLGPLNAYDLHIHCLDIGEQPELLWKAALASLQMRACDHFDPRNELDQ